MKNIGFIGVGIMGKSMVRNLMKAGYELHIYARTKSKVCDVIEEGAIFHDSIADCVKDRDAVITIVGFPKDVEEVYYDAGNILDSAKEGAYLIRLVPGSIPIITLSNSFTASFMVYDFNKCDKEHDFSSEFLDDDRPQGVACRVVPFPGAVEFAGFELEGV